ncbi:hypothetical protein Z945_900 [Sulfitobacter noctilucae]|uniref:hypothetical protein n=1 Tax=Sulfitobacter noctilucae TaxID=1342302 RepID=UPI00046AA1B2|nr:hypothetical protein [Sulfitobacter noctilucae]KIN65853.1 hypothetical protein Z945_900 [Sulfitobacter noctilucae]
MNTAPNNTTDKVKKTAANAAEGLKSGAQDAAEKAATEASQYADQAKGAAADEVKGVASALRTAADEMRSGSPQERTMSQIADGLADASDSIRGKDLGEMVGSISDFARRNPIAFLGGAALLGFAATRFAKASSENNRHTTAVAPLNNAQDLPHAQSAVVGRPTHLGDRS